MDSSIITRTIIHGDNLNEVHEVGWSGPADEFAPPVKWLGLA